MREPPFGKLLAQRFQFAQLTHARAAGGEPEVDNRNGAAGKKLVARHIVPVQILAHKGGEFLHAAVIAAVIGEHAGVAGDVHAAVRGHAHGAVKGFLRRLGVLFLDHGELAFNVADLFRLAADQLQLVRR